MSTTPQRHTLPADLFTLADHERHARARLDAPVWAYFSGGAADEITLRANRSAWDALTLAPRVLRPLAGGHTRCELLGRTLAHPILLAPVAFQRLAHADGELATAYAAAALGAEPITGTALARVLPRLQPGGAPVDVGPSGIYQAFYALAEGKNIDLRGIQTTLDFDLRTGDAAVDFVAYCLSPGSGEKPSRAVEAGLFFRSAHGKLEGAFRCP